MRYNTTNPSSSSHDAMTMFGIILANNNIISLMYYLSVYVCVYVCE